MLSRGVTKAPATPPSPVGSTSKRLHFLVKSFGLGENRPFSAPKGQHFENFLVSGVAAVGNVLHHRC